MSSPQLKQTRINKDNIVFSSDDSMNTDNSFNSSFEDDLEQGKWLLNCFRCEQFFPLKRANAIIFPEQSRSVRTNKVR